MKRNFLFIILLFITVSVVFVKCEDNSSGEENGKIVTKLVPQFISEKRFINSNPSQDVTQNTSIQYNGIGNPVKITIHTKTPVKTNNSDNSEGEFVIQEKIQTIDISYSNNAIPLQRNEYVAIILNGTNMYNSKSNFNYHYTNPDEITIQNESGQIVERIRVNSNDKVSEYQVFPEIDNTGKTTGFTEKYIYNSQGNIHRYIKEEARTTTQYDYTYDKESSIYKNINAPQWFITTLLCKNGIINNPYELQGKKDNRAVGWMTYRYQYNNDGYPIEIDCTPNMTWMGTYDSLVTIRYVEF